MKHLIFARRQERGQAVMEFALVGIVFFILVFGMIDVGRAVWNYNTLSEAARAGTRYAIVHGVNATDPSGPGDDADIIAEVEKNAPGLNDAAVNVSVNWLDGGNEPGHRVEVTAQYDYDPIFDFLGVVSFTMTSSSTMEITY